MTSKVVQQKRSYTQKEFNDALLLSGLQNTFSDSDIEIAKKNPTLGMQILEAKQMYVGAPEGSAGDMTRGLAHAQAEAARNEYKGTNKATKMGALALYGNTAARKKTDNGFATYRAEIEKAKKKTIEDVAGQMAALTGGYGSSSAATKAAAAGADYGVLLAEKQAEFEQQAYDRKFNEAQIAASMGDYSKLRALGIDTTAYEVQAQADRNAANYATKLSQAYNAASIGDFSQLAALGIDTSALKSDAESAKKAAEFSAAYKLAEVGDFSALDALGVDTMRLRETWAAQTSPQQVQTVTKPTIDADTALEAYQRGELTASVLAAMQYYYGNDYADSINPWTKADEDALKETDFYTELEGVLTAQDNDKAYEKLLAWRDAYKGNSQTASRYAAIYAHLLGITEPEAK